MLFSTFAWGDVWGGCTTSRVGRGQAAANPIHHDNVGVSVNVSQHDGLILRR